MHTKKIKPTQTPHKQWEVHKTISQQQQKHRFRTDGILGHRGFKCIYRHQTFTLDSDVVKSRHKRTTNTFTTPIAHPKSSKHPTCIR